MHTNGPTFENVTETLIVHFRGAVEHVAAFPETCSKIFSCFRFTRPGWPGRSAPHFQVQRLSYCPIDTMDNKNVHHSDMGKLCEKFVPEREVRDSIVYSTCKRRAKQEENMDDRTDSREAQRVVSSIFGRDLFWFSLQIRRFACRERWLRFVHLQ